MSLAPPPRKDMSYRKPAPVFVPSPPPSPQSVGSQLKRLSLSLGSALRGELPPLPDDWREVIQSALAQPSGNMLPIDAGVDIPSRPSSPALQDNQNRSSFLNEKPFRFFMTSYDISDAPTPPPRTPPPRTPTPHALPSRTPTPSSQRNDSRTQSPIGGHKRRLHQTYRPPTPPLEVHYKKRRNADSDIIFTNPFSAGREIYPDPPPPHSPLGQPRPSFSTYQGHSQSSMASYSTMPRNPSFDPEKPVYMNHSVHHGLWPASQTTFHSHVDSDRTGNTLRLPVLPKHTAYCRHSIPCDDGESSQRSRSIWQRLGAFFRAFGAFIC